MLIELKNGVWTANPFPIDPKYPSHQSQKSAESEEAITRNHQENKLSLVQDWLNHAVIGHNAQLCKDFVRYDILPIAPEMEKSQRERYLRGLLTAAIINSLKMIKNEDNTWYFCYSSFYAELLINKYKIQFSKKFQSKTIFKYKEKLKELKISSEVEYYDAQKIFNSDLAILKEDENY